jgi:peptidoglycan/xylan/chitin deacetylase (PgdA/CDA1 family)
MERFKRVVTRNWRSIFLLAASIVPVLLVGSRDLSIPTVMDPVVFSMAGTKFASVKLIPANQTLPAARIQAALLDSRDDALDTAVNAAIQSRVAAFTAALPAEPATAGFYHQLRIVPRVDYASGSTASVTLQIDEYHPVGVVHTSYESWIAMGTKVERPVLGDTLAEQVTHVLQLPADALKTQIGTPVALGFLPNYKVRIYDDGALAAYMHQPYVDVAMTRLPAAAKLYKSTYFSKYPFRPDASTQRMLDNGYERALKRNEQPTDCELVSCIALTFDDGPDADITPIILKTLANEEIKATFFVQGNQVQKAPALVRQAAAEGHEIENHTYAHPDLVKLRSPILIRKQIDDTQAALQSNGIQSKFLRPPYGSLDEHVKHVANMPLILWNVDAQEWRPGATPQAISDDIIAQTRSGSIILLHDTRRISAEALPLVIRGLKDRGFRFTTVDELLNIDGTARGVFASR